MAGNVSRRQGSTQIEAFSPNWFFMALACDLLVAIVIFASASTVVIWRYTRCTIDSYSSLFLNSLMNCLLRTSLERGQRRLPEPPESKIIFIIFSPLSLLQEFFSTLTNLCFHLFGRFFILCADRDIGLEFRFRTGRTHHNGTVIF